VTLAAKFSLGCIADDYTGASDLANTLTRAGLRTVQTIGVPSDDLALPDVDAVVVSLKSRSIEASLAVTRARRKSGCAAAAPRTSCSRSARPSIPPMPAISAR
jgi:hypothetical protein